MNLTFITTVVGETTEARTTVLQFNQFEVLSKYRNISFSDHEHRLPG